MNQESISNLEIFLGLDRMGSGGKVIRGQLEGSNSNKLGGCGGAYISMYEAEWGRSGEVTKGRRPSAALSFIIKILIYSQEEGQKPRYTAEWECYGNG